MRAVQAERIIPAYAGSTPRQGDLYHSLPDHPRLRGEHMPELAVVCCVGGSSPPTRGAQPPRRAHRPGMRIIPAYAGSTWFQGHSFPVDSDHPRLRGEHHFRLLGLFPRHGSSPPTRGAQLPFHIGVLTPRIIPAYAGSTKLWG